MKKILLLGVLVFGGFLIADYVEVKTGEGREYYNVRNKAKLYVCYDRRVKYVSEDRMYIRYDGCARYTYSCASNGLARFGKYPSVRAAKNALYRCRTSRPRFVD